MKKVISAFFLLACLLSPVATKAQKRVVPRVHQTPSAADVATAAMRSVVSIVTLDAMGQPLASGSGFFIDDATVLTNYHVVKNAQKVLVSQLVGERKQVSATLTCTDGPRDLAVLKPNGIVGIALKAAEKRHRVGDTVYVIGNPEGFSGTFSEGIISAFRALDGTSLVQITAPISHGSSGGPVLDENGRILGIATAFVKDAQNLNLAVELNGTDLTFLPYAVSDDAEARERGTDIFDAALVAKGRRQESQELRDYTLRLEVLRIIEGREIKEEHMSQYLLPDAQRVEWSARGGQRMVMGLKGHSGWTQQGDRTTDLWPELVKDMEEVMNRITAVLFLKLPRGSTVDALSDDSVIGRSADVVMVSGPDDFRLTLFFDKSSHLLLQSAYEAVDTTSVQKRPHTEVYSNYKQLSGFWIPLTTARFVDGTRKEAQSLIDFKVNSGLDGSISATPESAASKNQPTQTSSSDTWDFIVANSAIKYYGRNKDIQVLSDGHRSAWIKMLPGKPGRFGDNLHSLSGNRQAMMRTEFDCAGLRKKYLWLVTYPEDQLPNSRAMPDMGWFDIIPDSIDAAVAKYVCQ